MVQPFRLLRWLYLGRLTLAAGVFGGALLVWPEMEPRATRLVTLVFLLPLVVTGASAWHTHLRGRVPGSNFLYAQVIFDALLVTAVVHLTGGGESEFAPLYILVIAAGALLLPLPGGVLIGALASLLYFVDIVWAHASIPPGTVFIQIGLFALMALATGYLGDRLRQAGAALGEIESELRQLKLSTSDILGAIDTGVATIDGAGRLAYINPAGEGLLGLKESEWQGRPVLEELSRRAPGLAALIRRTATLRRPVRWYETRVPGVEGGEGDRTVGVRTTVLEPEGEEAPWVTVVVQDITDGKRVEELNRRAARLQAVAELAASLAHEIKNPLASIRSAVEQLGSGRIAAGDEAVLQRLVLTESDRLSRLLSDFIEFSWVKLQVPARVDLGKVAAEAIDLVQRHPDGGEGVRIEYDPPREPVVVEGDEDLLHRAVFNLVLNAVQHSGRGGVVRVEVGRASEAEIPAGVPFASPARIAVSDTGPGVPAEHAQRIFDPFFTTRQGGTGLGLALVHRAVEAHRGAIFLENAPGRGARFTVYLPTDVDDGG